MEVFDPEEYLKRLKLNIIELAKISQSINKKESSDMNKYYDKKSDCKRYFIYILPISVYTTVYTDFLKTSKTLFIPLEILISRGYDAEKKKYIANFDNMLRWFLRILIEKSMHSKILEYSVRRYLIFNPTVDKSKLTIGHLRDYLLTLYKEYWSQCITRVPKLETGSFSEVQRQELSKDFDNIFNKVKSVFPLTL